MISNFLQNGNVGNIATSKQAEARKAIMERWENIGFTKVLDSYLKNQDDKAVQKKVLIFD